MAQKQFLEETAFYRLGMWLATHKKWILFFSFLLFVFSAATAPIFMSNLKTTNPVVVDSQAQRAKELIDSRFSKKYTEQDLIVFHSGKFIFDDPAYQKLIAEVSKAMQGIEGIEQLMFPIPNDPQSAGMISKDQHTAIALVGITVDEKQIATTIQAIDERIKPYKNGNIEVYLTGDTPLKQALLDTNAKDVAQAEAKGMPIAFIILLLAFGSLIAAGMPIVLSMIGLMTTFGLLGVVSIFHPFDTTVSGIAPMIGLGVGIDYILFLVRRFKEELEVGHTKEVAVARMMGTTGKAIFFSGLTVMISMGGLFWLQSDVFFNIAVATMTVVVCMMLISLLLLPTLLATLGHRVNWLRIDFWRKNKRVIPLDQRFWYRWSALVVRRPIGFLLFGVIVLGILSTQVFGLKLGMNLGMDALSDQPAGKGMQLVQQQFSSGLLSPVRLVLEKDSGAFAEADWQAVKRIADRIADEEEVYRVDSLPSIVFSAGLPFNDDTMKQLLNSPKADQIKSLWNGDGDGRVAVVNITLKHGSDSKEAAEWIRSLRDDLLTDAVKDTGLKSSIGGFAMSIVELSEETLNKTPLVIFTVLILSYLLLLVAFRSWLIPLKAIFLNLLSVGAAYGLLVWVFIGGNGGWIGVEQIPFVQVFLPVIAFTVLFGLSMDYEVFLVGRIKEEWGATGDAKKAIVRGISHTSGPITQAGLIMIAVFTSFFLTKAMDTKQIGFALGTAILIDVTLVRAMLLPAMMSLLGRQAWSLPRWLERMLPRVDLSE